MKPFDYTLFVSAPTCFSSWLDYRLDDAPDDWPRPRQRYSPGKVSWGADHKRSLAISNRVNTPRREANRKQFGDEILPALWPSLRPDDALTFAKMFKLPSEKVTALGWEYWTVPNGRSGWVHRDDLEKQARAVALGASKTQPPAIPE
jgi:hypothetical protein